MATVEIGTPPKPVLTDALHYLYIVFWTKVICTFTVRQNIPVQLDFFVGTLFFACNIKKKSFQKHMSNWQGNLNRVVQKFKTLISKTKFALFFKQVQFIFKI